MGLSSPQAGLFGCKLTRSLTVARLVSPSIMQPQMKAARCRRRSVNQHAGVTSRRYQFSPVTCSGH